MASLDKYTTRAVNKILRHNTREHISPSKNKDIDPKRTHLNYAVHPPDRGRTAAEARDYYNSRIENVYIYNRADVKTLCEWVITSPKDLNPAMEDLFFKETYNFLNSLYTERNCVQCIVHYDEGVKSDKGEIIAGRPHMHYLFVPVVDNKRYMHPNKNGNLTKISMYEEKICSKELIGNLNNFHPRFQKWIDSKGLSCTVHSGITKGKNRSVVELKLETKERELEKSRSRNLELEKEINLLKEKLISLENEKTIEASWGSSSGWDSDEWRSDTSWDLDIEL